MRSQIKRSVVTSTIHVATVDENLQVVQAEPLVVTGDYSDKKKAQSLVNKKASGFTVTSVTTEKATYALDTKTFMELATIVPDEPESENDSQEA